MRLLALTSYFSDTAAVETPLNQLKAPKWPFVLGQVLLLGFAYFIVRHSPHPISNGEIAACFAAALAGVLVGVAPFVIDYKLMQKKIEGQALGEVAEKIKNLEQVANQITSATSQWTHVQDQAEKTSATAKEIASRMSEEVRQFSEFMQKMNDSEKVALRLETEKSKRAEGEWLSVLVRILDHVFLLHAAATRSGQPALAEQITHFQNACRDAARRVGLTPFVAEPGEPFNAERHQVVGGGKPDPEGSIGGIVGTGYTFQGKLIRPVLVTLREAGSAESPTRPPEPSLAGEKPEGELPLEPSA
jgi:molecular chaperone GrpE (heat shock protein)